MVKKKKRDQGARLCMKDDGNDRVLTVSEYNRIKNRLWVGFAIGSGFSTILWIGVLWILGYPPPI